MPKKKLPPQDPNIAFISACEEFDTLHAKLAELRRGNFGVPDTRRTLGNVGPVLAGFQSLRDAVAFLTWDNGEC